MNFRQQDYFARIFKRILQSWQHLIEKRRIFILQSENIIVDARFSKMHIAKITNELQYQYKRTSSIKRLIMINKQRQIIEFKK